MINDDGNLKKKRKYVKKVKPGEEIKNEEIKDIVPKKRKYVKKVKPGEEIKNEEIKDIVPKKRKYVKKVKPGEEIKNEEIKDIVPKKRKYVKKVRFYSAVKDYGVYWDQFYYSRNKNLLALLNYENSLRLEKEKENEAYLENQEKIKNEDEKNIIVNNEAYLENQEKIKNEDEKNIKNIVNLEKLLKKKKKILINKSKYKSKTKLCFDWGSYLNEKWFESKDPLYNAKDLDPLYPFFHTSNTFYK